MELQQLRYFRSVAKLQHMTKASIEQRVAQPSLSKSIRLLESELGVKLFDRKGRGLHLNAFGKAFLRHVESAFRSLDDGKRELDDMASRRENHVVVAAVALNWAAGVFKAFSIERPEVKFRLYQRTPAEMVKQLARNEVDLCLVVNPGLPEIEWTPLVSGNLYVMVPPGHRHWGRGEVTLEELSTEPIIMPRTGAPVRDLVEEAFRLAGLTPNIICDSDDVMAISELVRAGLGVQFIPDLQRGLSAGNDPGFPLLIDPKINVEVGIAFQRDSYHSLAARDFASFARKYFSEKP